MKKIKILDLFAGVGGLSLGFELLKDNSGFDFELHRAAEIDSFACETLRNRYGSEAVIEGDITKLPIANKIIQDCKGVVDVVVGGIPCQSFSLIGPRSGYGKKIEKFKNDERDNLYEHFRDIVAEVDPKVIVIENVKGILSKRNNEGKLIIEQIISDFEKLGYVFENDHNDNKYMVLNSADFGVPQVRERVILIGIHKKIGVAKVPFIKTTHFDPEKKKSERGKLPYVTLAEAIGDLPKITAPMTRTGLSEDEWVNAQRRNKRVFSGAEVMEVCKGSFLEHKKKSSTAGRKFLAHARHGNSKEIHHHISRPHQKTDLELFKRMRQGETAKAFYERCPEHANSLIKYTMGSFQDKYRRQSWSRPSTTVFAHLSKDGNRFIHPTQARSLTPREAARVQSFPDSFLFSGPMNQKYKQIGNAVPPLLGKAIATSVAKSLSSKMS